jgi:hypothetical protein
MLLFSTMQCVACVEFNLNKFDVLVGSEIHALQDQEGAEIVCAWRQCGRVQERKGQVQHEDAQSCKLLVCGVDLIEVWLRVLARRARDPLRYAV